MHLDRREALKRILIVGGGVLLLPSCLSEESKTPLSFKNIPISDKEENILADLASAIIPTTQVPGAAEVNAHLFALKMIDDCYKKEDQKRFSRGLQQFEKLVNKQSGNSFTEISPLEKEELLKALEKGHNIPKEVLFFYSTFKELCLQGYLTSKYYLTKVQVYQLVPVHFNGCVPVKNKEQKS
jgi:hypothetical protein